jgi:hypothetical protein
MKNKLTYEKLRKNFFAGVELTSPCSLFFSVQQALTYISKNYKNYLIEYSISDIFKFLKSSWRYRQNLYYI